ncbi:MAG TPA: proline--tRNA ligase, partial [Kofleriaceae bacterium]|nr:proline--tRNA ligase [Kofleriaceae bacterium]
MRLSRAFLPTLKEVPADAQVASHIFLVRAGLMRRLAAGIYTFLPLGWRVLHNIEAIIRDEMNRAGAQEVLMPAAIPAELWQESGRWEKYGPELLRFSDRKGAKFCFGPTHEEVIVDLVRHDLKSYRDLPQNLYQIQSKFRDEMRPRAGLLRGREFIMKDAYSFDVSVSAAEASYRGMYAAYERIFSRAGLAFRVVEADTGAIGGSQSHEFQVLAESGEDTLVACDGCDYAANVEQAEVVAAAPLKSADGPLEKVATPGKKTIDEVAAFFGEEPARLIKTLIYMADGKAVAILCRGDRAVNEVAVKKLVGATELYLATDAQVTEATGAASGFAGPVGLAIPVYADRELEGTTGMIAGANETDFHLTGVKLARDAEVLAYAPVRMAEAGDLCPRCEKGHFEVLRGIEVGHVFLLGTRYSEPMKCTFLDEEGAQQPMVMGCYGIGITRIMAAAIEQNHDDDGIIWPLAIAPFAVEIVGLGADAEVASAAEELYAELLARGIEVLLDDRDERPGAKLKDADLIGIPLRVVIGKRSLKEGQLEV